MYRSRRREEELFMQQPIIGYHMDEFSDWVADLRCGHGQHVRHQPPMTYRLWVLTEEGRAQHLGETLNCKKCDEASG
jgi:cytochrome c-type biogenesis protein CcmH/NrfF